MIKQTINLSLEVEAKMRFYKIVIDGKPIIELNQENPYAPRITFDLRQFEGNEIPNAIITIYNVGISFLGDLKKFEGKKFELYAGIKNQTLLQKAGVSEIKNNLIGYGYVATASANPNLGKDNQINFLLRPSSALNDKTFLLELKAGDNLKDKIKQALQSIYTDCIVELGGLNMQSKGKEKIKVAGIGDLTPLLIKSKIQIYRTTKGFLIADDSYKAEARVINPQDFLEKPSQIRTSTIQASFHMRGDFKIGSVITIPSKIFATIPPQTKFILAKPNSYIQGRYKIVKIWHIGDSRGVGAQSWATNIEAIKESE